MTDKIRKLAMKAKFHATMACNNDDKLDYDVLFENQLVAFVLDAVMDGILATKTLGPRQIEELCVRIVEQFED